MTLKLNIDDIMEQTKRITKMKGRKLISKIAKTTIYNLDCFDKGTVSGNEVS